MFSSMKAKIVVFYMVVLFVTLSVLGVFLYFSLSKIVHQSIDSSLASRAKALATLVHSDNNGSEFNFSDEVIWEYNSPKSKHFFQVRHGDGTTLEKSTSLGNQDLPFMEKEEGTNFRTIRLNGNPIRVINYFVPGETDYGNIGKRALTKDKASVLIIQCAEDVDERLDYLERYSLVLSLSIISILIISASGGFLIARKALKPVKEISKAIDRISESNLSERISVEKIPAELKDLAVSFNQTFNSLEQAFIRQKQFTADASHELRTPLSVILSQCEITLRRIRGIADYQKALKAIAQAAALMSEIVRKLLTINRLEADKASLKTESIWLDEIIREAVKLLTPLAEEKRVMVNMILPDSVSLQGDRSALLELLTNLVENAIKYNVPQGQITISLKKERPWLVCEIKDSGIGIPEEDLERVFDRFYRVDKSRSKEIGGCGLGLSICKEIVKLHGGKIEIKSQLGSGTNVSVYVKVQGIYG